MKNLIENANYWLNEDDSDGHDGEKYGKMEDEVREQINSIAPIVSKDGIEWGLATDPNGGIYLLRQNKEDRKNDIYMTPYWEGYPNLAVGVYLNPGEENEVMDELTFPLNPDNVDMDEIKTKMTDALNDVLDKYDFDWDPIESKKEV